MPAGLLKPWTDFARHLRDGMVNCGIFKIDLIPIAIEKIEARFIRFDNLGYKNALEDGPTLSLEEKKKLGLRSRRKYSEGFIAFIDINSLNGRCPNTIFGSVFMAAWFHTKRQIELAKMKADGLYKTIDILVLDDCCAIKSAAKRYVIDDVPELPLPNCTVDCCRCLYNVGDIDLVDQH